RHDHLEAIALHPTIVLRTTPGGVRINAPRDVAPPSILRSPRRSLPGHQTLVDRYRSGIGPAGLDRAFALQADGLTEQPMRASIALVKRRATRQTLARQPARKITAPLRPPRELSRFGLFSQAHADHNHERQYPVGDLRFAPWSVARAAP